MKTTSMLLLFAGLSASTSASVRIPDNYLSKCDSLEASEERVACLSQDLAKLEGIKSSLLYVFDESMEADDKPPAPAPAPAPKKKDPAPAPAPPPVDPNKGKYKFTESELYYFIFQVICAYCCCQCCCFCSIVGCAVISKKK